MTNEKLETFRLLLQELYNDTHPNSLKIQTNNKIKVQIDDSNYHFSGGLDFYLKEDVNVTTVTRT